MNYGRLFPINLNILRKSCMILLAFLKSKSKRKKKLNLRQKCVVENYTRLTIKVQFKFMFLLLQVLKAKVFLYFSVLIECNLKISVFNPNVGKTNAYIVIRIKILQEKKNGIEFLTFLNQFHIKETIQMSEKVGGMLNYQIFLGYR